jgi:hypothetical protein
MAEEVIVQEPVQQQTATQVQGTDVSVQQQQTITEQPAQTPEQGSTEQPQEQQKIQESFHPHFLVYSKSISLYLFHSPICKEIRVTEKDGHITAVNEYGVSCGNPLVESWRGNGIPSSSDIAWEKAKEQLELYNGGRKKRGEPGITFDNEEKTRLQFNRSFAEALSKYDSLREKKQPETAQEEQASPSSESQKQTDST